MNALAALVIITVHAAEPVELRVSGRGAGSDIYAQKIGQRVKAEVAAVVPAGRKVTSFGF